MADYKMRALRSYEGTEGVIRRGDVFTVDGKERADELARLQLAEQTDDGAEVTNWSQRNAELDDMKVDELKSLADDEGATYRADATKPEIKSAIIKNRENEYIKEQARQTAVYSNNSQPTTNTDTTTDNEGGAE